MVGVIGTAVQLTVLTMLNHWKHGQYLYASVAATELTLIHNFVWHWHYTWRDRRNTITPFKQFIVFQLSNGLVSLAGNLILIQVFIHEFHLPLLFSNLAAILICSIANFCLGDNWAFAEVRRKSAI
jgi:putative flippase GtrA